MYSVVELMDDVSFAWHLEKTRRAIDKCENIEEMRRLSANCIVLMKAQRSIMHKMLTQDWGE